MKITPRMIIVAILIGTIGIVGYIRSQSASRVAESKNIDILIVSPHPDDAARCCSGLIQQSLTLKKTVHIVNVTNGDGHTDAAAALAKKDASTLIPDDMVALGMTRQKETVRAMGGLGISPSHITFLGYPDGWLDEVYKHDGTGPFTNPFTQTSKTPGTNHPFTRVSAVADIASLIGVLKPAQIIIPARTDEALDHVVTNLFVTDAMRLTEYSGTLLRFVTQEKNDATGSGNPLFTLTLTDDQRRKKDEALKTHTSYAAVDNGYLKALNLKEEIFY